jgi:hypothetical protein
MKKFATLPGLAAALLIASIANAINPIIQTVYTPDPAPLVHDKTVYVYTGHDEDGSTWFTMKEWRVYSSTDMVNWTDLGSPLSLKDFSWAKADAWAGQCIERDGKFYFYVPINQKSGGMSIGVAVGDSPTGPFQDPLGKPLVFDRHGDIDPTVFIDDDDQAYLAWGNPTYKYVKLNKDMISYDKSMGDEEGPWFYKRNGRYYLFFAGGPIPEHLAYSTGPSPEGPWTYGGIVMPAQGGSFTNHPGVVDYKGKTFLFYHNGALPGGGGFTRSVCVDELRFNADGSAVQTNMTKAGPAPVDTLDPYKRVEAETIAWESGIETEPFSDGGMVVHDIDNGDYIQAKNVDFGDEGARKFVARVACDGSSSAAIELRVDGKDGTLVGNVPVASTAGEWRTVTAEVNGAHGVHDLFLVFTGEAGDELFEFDYWEFRQ